MKDLYVLATRARTPIELSLVRDAYEGEGVRVLTDVPDALFAVQADKVRVDVRFEPGTAGRIGGTEPLTGGAEALSALDAARGLYWVSFVPGEPQPSVAVFEALWCARALMERVGGVLVDRTSYKVHTVSDIVELTELDFDIRDHVGFHALHARETGLPLWLHTHGMEKFGSRDVEVFNLAEEDLPAAQVFLRELCTDVAFGQGPPFRAGVETSTGASFMLLPSEEARLNLFAMPQETFDGHPGLYLTVVAADGRHSMSELLRPYRDRFEHETPEDAEEAFQQARELLPTFKARFLRKGLMEPLTFLVRAPFEAASPAGAGSHEDLWVEVLAWDDDGVVGRIVDGGALTSDWRKGSQVQLEEQMINAVALGRDGKTLDEDEMRRLLEAERPV